MTLAIKNWGKHYETSETRKLKRLAWIPVPNKHDGRGLARLMRRQDGLLIFGAWILILQVASKMPQRGVLEDQDGPLTFQDIADKTHASPEHIKLALSVLCSEEINWISQYPPDSQQKPLETQVRREGKGMEGNRREAAAADIQAKPTPRMDPAAEPSTQSPTPDLSDRIASVTEELFAAHAAVGLIPGNRFDAERAVAEILDGAVSPANVLASLLPAHTAYAPYWRERLRSGTLKAHMLPIARFIRDGDYLAPPAAIEPVKASASREYVVPWTKPLDGPEEAAV